MKYFKRLSIYKASNVTFDANNIKAVSYAWWTFCTVINGQVVFNTYNYSSSTCKHQQKVLRLMRELGIEIDLYVSTRDSLSSPSLALDNAVKGLNQDIAELKEKLVSNRRKKALDAGRYQTIVNKLNHIKKIQVLQHGSELNLALS
jgi:glutaredoxin